VISFEESCFRTLSIVQCFSLRTTFRKLALLPSSGKKNVEGMAHPSPPPSLPEDGSRASFQNAFKEKHWTKDKVLKQDSSKCITPSSEPFRIDLE
jgi:hypothetical protein